MLNWRVPWWMYLMAGVYVLAFLFNARQEASGPANAGWVPLWPAFTVASVAPGRAMEKAGLRAGDVVEAVNGQPVTGMPDWFVARAHFERNQPIKLQIRRGEQHLLLQVVITAPAWRTWSRAHLVGEVAFYFVRFILLLLAIVVAFSRPERFRTRLAALMLAIGAVAERLPKFWLGSRAASPARRARGSNMPGHSFVPDGIAALAAVFCDFSFTLAFGRVAMGTGARPRSRLWTPDGSLGDGNDLRALSFGTALAAVAFGDPSASDTRYRRRLPFSVSQCAAGLSADDSACASGAVVYLFCSIRVLKNGL